MELNTNRNNMAYPKNGIRDQGLSVGPKTRDPEPETLNVGPGTLKLGVQQIFSVFFEAWHL